MNNRAPFVAAGSILIFGLGPLWAQTVDLATSKQL